jgi:hypothetical protein
MQDLAGAAVEAGLRAHSARHAAALCASSRRGGVPHRLLCWHQLRRCDSGEPRSAARDPTVLHACRHARHPGAAAEARPRSPRVPAQAAARRRPGVGRRAGVGGQGRGPAHAARRRPPLPRGDLALDRADAGALRRVARRRAALGARAQLLPAALWPLPALAGAAGARRGALRARCAAQPVRAPRELPAAVGPQGAARGAALCRRLPLPAPRGGGRRPRASRADAAVGGGPQVRDAREPEPGEGASSAARAGEAAARGGLCGGAHAVDGREQPRGARDARQRCWWRVPSAL